MTEQRRAQWPGQERNAEGQERREHLCRAGGLREEYRPDDQRGGSGVDVEVVELDGGTDEACGGHPGGRVGRTYRALVARLIGGSTGHAGIPGSHLACQRAAKSLTRAGAIVNYCGYSAEQTSPDAGEGVGSARDGSGRQGSRVKTSG